MIYEEKIKPIKLSFAPDAPVKFSDSDEDFTISPTDLQKQILMQVGEAIDVYLKTAKELLNGKYSAIREVAPLHLSNPGNVLVLHCQDGLIIRYERKHDKSGIMLAWSPEKLSQLAPKVSEFVLCCHEDKNCTSSVPANGPTIRLFTTDESRSETKEILSLKIVFNAILNQPILDMPLPPCKPYCLLSVRNSFEFNIVGEMIQDGIGIEKGKRVLSRTMINLPVGWDCIEIYPFLNLDHWKSEFAKIWAENDLLSAVVSQQFREKQYRELDPKAAVRKAYGELFKTYKNLLDSNPEKEEILQNFLEEHPELLCPTQIKTWPKLSLGSRKTDFVFQEATRDYLLVELERSTFPLFLKNGDTTRELNHARNQILDWKRYLEDNLSTVQREIGLAGISTNPRSLIVIGRSSSLTEENKRKLIALENESPKTKIMTYDDVLVNAKTIVENLLGPIWETYGTTEVFYLPDK